MLANIFKQYEQTKIIKVDDEKSPKKEKIRKVSLFEKLKKKEIMARKYFSENSNAR